VDFQEMGVPAQGDCAVACVLAGAMPDVFQLPLKVESITVEQHSMLYTARQGMYELRDRVHHKFFGHGEHPESGRTPGVSGDDHPAVVSRVAADSGHDTCR